MPARAGRWYAYTVHRPPRPRTAPRRAAARRCAAARSIAAAARFAAASTIAWTAVALAQAPSWALLPWVEGLTLPVAVATVPDRADRWLVVQLEGLVLDVRDRTVRDVPFLDLRHRVTGLLGEQGLFSVAVEPQVRAAQLGRARHAVAAFTERDTGDLLVAAYPIDEGAWLADGFAEVEVLRVPMPDPFHHGGYLRFGPDGHLYVSVGDGRRAAPDDHDRARDAGLRGRLLRIDLLPGPGAVPAYAVPPDNPFAAAPGEHPPETWAYGFRNPWKFTFDPDGGEVLAVDVGADRWEEVHRVVPGGDHGWPAREGPACVEREDGAGLVDPGCPEASHVPPWLTYGHLAFDPDGGHAVTGGVIVRDPQLAALAGRYLFGDFVTGRVWSDDPAGRGHVLVLEAGPGLAALEEGPAGEILLVSLSGAIRRLVPAAGP